MSKPLEDEIKNKDLPVFLSSKRNEFRDIKNFLEGLDIILKTGAILLFLKNNKTQ